MATAPSLQRTSSRRASRSSCSPTDSPVPYESPAGYIVPGPGLVTRRQPGGRAVLTSGVGISTSARVLERKAHSGFEAVLAWWRDEILEPTIAKLCARSDCRIDDSGSDRAVPTDTRPACASDDVHASRAPEVTLVLRPGEGREPSGRPHARSSSNASVNCGPVARAAVGANAEAAEYSPRRGSCFLRPWRGRAS